MSRHLALINSFDSVGLGPRADVPIFIPRVRVQQKLFSIVWIRIWVLFYRFWIRILVQSTWTRWFLDKDVDGNEDKDEDHSPTLTLQVFPTL